MRKGGQNKEIKIQCSGGDTGAGERKSKKYRHSVLKNSCICGLLIFVSQEAAAR
jgi:hypothetical protein